MFFFLSKTLSYLVAPITIISACLFASLLVKHKVWRKRLTLGGVILLLFFSNEFIANEFMKAWEVKAKPFADMRHYKVGIVLTGVTIPELTPGDRIYFQKGADRIVHTVQLYKLGIIDKILVSGGSGRIVVLEEREANQFRDAMLLMGVPDSVIVLENQTRNTRESAVEVKKMLADLGYSSDECVLITSAFHMRRSLACYAKVGLDIDPFSTDFYARQGDYYFDAFFIPKLEALIIWHKLSREWMGFIAYWTAGYV